MKRPFIKLNAVDILATTLFLVFIITWFNYQTEVCIPKKITTCYKLLRHF